MCLLYTVFWVLGGAIGYVMATASTGYESAAAAKRLEARRNGHGALIRRQKRDPCPGQNNTTLDLASGQKFQVFCGSDITGTPLFQAMRPDLMTCADLCTTIHPRCDAATFSSDTGQCALKAFLPTNASSAMTPSNFDTVIPIPRVAKSNCPSLRGNQVVEGSGFQMFCSMVSNGNDLAQVFASDFQTCMGLCVANSLCNGISFDPAQTQGLRNCYLKKSLNVSGLIQLDGVDSALAITRSANAEAQGKDGGDDDDGKDGNRGDGRTRRPQNDRDGVAPPGVKAYQSIDMDTKPWIIASAAGSSAVVVFIVVMVCLRSRERGARRQRGKVLDEDYYEKPQRRRSMSGGASQ